MEGGMKQDHPETAYHEAGHAVVAWEQRRHFTRVNACHHRAGCRLNLDLAAA